MIVVAVVASAVAHAAPGNAVFGSVVAIGGSASDIALDETRGLLYIANFGAGTIQVMSTVDNTIHSSMNVLPWPGALALSFDAQYLLIAHYCDVTTPPGQTSPACTNAVSSVHLADLSVQVVSLASPPLGVAFLGNGEALIVTAANFLLFNPATGVTQLLGNVTDVSKTLPVPLATFPGQIVQASLTSSADGSTVWGIASAGTSTQLIFKYSGATSQISAVIETSSPLLLPRISSSADGSYAMVGYTLVGSDLGTYPYLKGRYPNVITSTNITGSAIDSTNGIIYAQFPDTNQPTGPPTSISASTTPAFPPAMLVMDADNLTFRDRISLPEDMVGRAVLNAAATMMYAVSESGVMVLPVGSLKASHRLAAAQEDILLTTNFCNSGLLTQSLTITDPGGGKTDFAVATTQAGVTILPASGVTPATVQVVVDPKAIAGSGGTTPVWLTLTSQTGVNWPKPIRLLLNNPDPSQHGTLVDQPGVLSDILPDAARNRVYVLRQDLNQLRVFDGSSLNLIATLRTATSPTMMAMTIDGKYLLVGHDDSQLVTVYDLNALQPVTPVLMPGSHYIRSIAVSNAAILALARNEEGTPPAVIDSINLSAGTAAPLLTLGVYTNSVSPSGVLAASPGGVNILYASPDGNVALYSSSANTFVNSRHDFTALSGAFAASDFGSNIVGNSILNSSLVPSGVVSASALLSSGFTFVVQGGYMASAASPSAAGSMVQASLQTNAPGPVLTMESPIVTSEAPLLPTATTPSPAIYPSWGTYGSGSTSAHAANSFTRTVAPLPAGNVVTLSTSGLTMLAPSYPAGATPAITSIVSAADGSKAVAPGGLISIYGQNMSAASFTDTALPLPTGLGNACIGVNGTPIPLLYVSSGQINAQLPFNATNDATLTIHSPGGTSNNYSLTIQPTAPSVFMDGVAGPQTGLPIIVRTGNGQLVTPTNPVYPKDTLIIYLTGMGQTTPAIPAGQPAPSSPLSYASAAPVITLGGATLSVGYAGLAPGEVGVYQINATVPSGVPTGLSVPLVIAQGGATTTLNVRVVN